MTISSLERGPVLVPAWVAKQLSRHGLALSALLKLDTLGTVLSQEDLVLLHELNTNPMLILGVPYIRMGLLEYWHRFSDALSRVQELSCLYPGQSNARLFAAAGLEQQASGDSLANPRANGCTPFEVREAEARLDVASVLFVIVQPGHFGGPSTPLLQQALRRELLKQSYASRPFEAVARDPIFARYFAML